MKHKREQSAFQSGFTRREFVQAASAYLITPLLDPLDHSMLPGKHTQKRKLLKGEFKSFNAYEATVIEEVTSLIIPTDDHPGAREAGVVYEIDRIVAGTEQEKKVCLIGIKWLDGMARNNFKKNSFLDVNHDIKIRILRTADAYKLPGLSKNPPGKPSGEQVVKLFFELVKKYTFETFYTRKEGWDVAGYDGPPQWSGNRDYHTCS